MYIHVRVFPGQKREKIVEQKPGYFEVFVREKAEYNMANCKIIELIGIFYAIPTSSVRMVFGHHTRTKILSVVDIAN